MPIKEVLQDTYTHFQHSSKRQQILQEFREFTDTATYKLVQHCSTRWLSLQTCVNRYLQQWPALEAYFTIHNESERRGSCVARVVENLQDPLLPLTFHFLSYILKPLNGFNTDFQNGDAMAGHLHEEMRVIRTVMSKFVKMHVIKSAADVTKVDYATRHNQHDDDNIGVGQDARNYMKSDDVTSQTKANFFSKVRAFYMEMTEKMLSKFPSATWPFALGVGTVDAIQDEFLIAHSSRPAYKNGLPLDPYWAAMLKVVTSLQKVRFSTLVPLAFAALSLPHSNADPERCFSSLKKIQRDDRGNLNKNAINALLSLKYNFKTPCFKTDIMSDTCAEARKVCN
ncbi:hypothetical protein MAR_029235 [Mya arenaria]|uniref:HAT C-terminal dimerisation domain-containing protein n=1 Tax=Mya arenaria TaxID=6604 RepID=A0ABY7DNG6_MYAAR|nr:hypothetical protein MAR_029235 [Mya arenaria]